MGELELKRVLLNNLLETEELTIVFQPIFNISSNLPFGYEALTRGPKNHPLQTPTELFYSCRANGFVI